MSGGVSVHGGSDGVQAHIEDMLAARRVFSDAADQVERVIAMCFWISNTLSGTVTFIDAAGSLAAHDALRAAAVRVNGIDDDLRAVGVALTLAIDGYRDADSGVLGRLGSVLLAPYEAAVALPGALVDSGKTLWTDGGSRAVQAFLTDDPALIDVTTGLLTCTVPPLDRALLELLADRYFDDGHPVVSPRLDVRLEASAPPRGVADLMAGLSSRNGGGDGEVDVRILTGPNGRRHVVVDIPGTKDWTPAHETADVVGWATNIRAIDGAETTYEKGVLDAMRQAGVRPSDDVMVVGHSLGGMVAVALARDAVRSGRFNVTHVVTAGAPIARFVGRLPAGVQVLALENKHDVVPHLDGESNPDRPNITTATFDEDTGTVGDDHGLDTAYRPGAAEVDASDDAAIRAFLASASGYFGATSVRTRTYVITRKTD